MDIPNRFLLRETIRNLMFHVPMWFTMIVILFVSFISSILFLNGFNLKYDAIANQAVNVGLIFAFLDPKLNGSALSTLIFLTYKLIRYIPDARSRGMVSSVYNIFAFIMMIVFIMVLPRLADSLHPGNGGNPAFSSYDLDSILRMLFYPAVIGWILLGVWMLQINTKLNKIKTKVDEIQFDN